jgi:Xaa-Pro aminopeptidase
LVDEVWKDRPLPKASPISIHPLELIGCSIKEKLGYLRGKIAQKKVEAIIISALDEVAWLYNIHGSDIAYNLVVQAYVIVTRASSFCYVDKIKVTSEVEKYLCENGITIRNYRCDFQAIEINLNYNYPVCSLKHDTMAQ